MEYGTKASGVSMGDNAGKGNRAIAAHVKGLHAAAGHSGNSVSSLMSPTRSVKQPGQSESVLKSPSKTSKPID